MYSKLLKSGFDRTYEGFVCRDAYGKLITPNFVSDHFKNMVRKYGLRKLRFHDLRHSCASLLLANGESMKAIQDWLGHSTFNVTANFTVISITRQGFSRQKPLQESSAMMTMKMKKTKKSQALCKNLRP